VFNRSTIANRRFNLLLLGALALTFLGTTISGLNRMLDTVPLDGDQWRVCWIIAATYVVVAELGKILFRLVTHDEVHH
jgi:Ca2+-transporting ATPase